MDVQHFFDIAIKIVAVLEFFDLEFEAFGNVGAFVGFVELIKGCSKDRIPVSVARSILFDETNPERLRKSAVSKV